VGVWGLLLRPIFEPVTARAAGDQSITLRLTADPINLNINHSGNGQNPSPVRVQLEKAN
jgi:hypothetical protein